MQAIIHKGELHKFDERGFEQLFASNGWTNAWVNGVFEYDHYHTNTHEVLGCYAGHARIRFGGPQGEVVELEAGDVVVIPAGLAHCRLDASPEFGVVGAYPDGAEPDLKRGPGEALDLPRPEADPALGPGRGFAG
ncbi:cupin domain-containing protein [Paracoccus sp. S-4012]|uniref:cupin domain-containing protein n=1 Tax=Paracoccus sp. S-4012 TaxID=2665648 RepID=UPI0012B02413|nr:cupin domain-containing protein [Paracoccus sp. S-4012]MRX50165.1 cupin domain-containing protein [Paracoccus sp. S-4012]